MSKGMRSIPFWYRIIGLRGSVDEFTWVEATVAWVMLAWGCALIGVLIGVPLIGTLLLGMLLGALIGSVVGYAIGYWIIKHGSRNSKEPRNRPE